jgi:DNA-binding NarL/FixJ family response regulator
VKKKGHKRELIRKDTCAFWCQILEDFEVVELFSLYLLDYSLGFELAILIREFDNSTPILFITGSHTVMVEHVLDVGAQGVITKDDFPDNLLKAVPRVLNA